tara:strand:- start:237 stop:830 length:594 start_codon:yes stop_codon:yes gene_type:complete
MAKRPDRRPAPRSGGRPTAEELELFHRAMADAARLKRRPRRAETGTGDAASEPPPIPKIPRAPRPQAAPAGTGPASSGPAAPALAAGIPEGLDRRTMDRLRKGRLRPEARIDLHGMTAQAAHGALGGFLASAQAAGKRCVLVITGKGSLKDGGGVLRRELPIWLNANDNRARVIGFAQAQPADGGGGAFYVLLKRRR